MTDIASPSQFSVWSWHRVTRDVSPCHDSWHVTITGAISGPLHAASPLITAWWSSHCVDSRLARISSLLSRASRLARISSLLSRVSGVGWWAARCHMSDMSHCDRPLSRNYVKCPDKNPDPEERESWDPQADGVSESTGLSVTVITELQCGHRDEHLPESFYHFNLCSFGTKSSELWVWPIVSEDNWWRSAPQPSHK